MSRLVLIPKELMSPGKVDEVVEFIAGLKGRAKDRKELLIDWCRAMDVPVTAGMIERVYPLGAYV